MAKVNKKNYKSDYAVVKKILELFDSGYSKREVAEEMHEEGHMNAFLRNIEMVTFIREKNPLKRLYICDNMSEIEEDEKEYPEDGVVAQEMLDMLDNGYDWVKIFNEICKKGKFTSFRRNYKIVYSIYESDKMEKSIKESKEKNEDS